MALGTVNVKSVDMRDDMQQEVITCALRVSIIDLHVETHELVRWVRKCMAGLQALELHDVEKDAASFIKKSFDEKFEPTWHCIVGKSFGALHLGSVSWID